MKSDKDDLEAAWEVLQPNTPVAADPPPAPKKQKQVKAKPRPRATVPWPSLPVLPEPPPPRPSPSLYDTVLTFLDEALDMERLFTILLFSVVAALAGGILWVSWKSISADGKITSCYVETQGGNGFSHDTYYVKGNIDWRPDVSMAAYPTAEAAVEGKKHLCP